VFIGQMPFYMYYYVLHYVMVCFRKCWTAHAQR